MKKEFFGTLPTGEKVYKYTISNGALTAVIMDRGAILVSLKRGRLDIVGGFDTLKDYLKDTSHQGATIGRVANRIENAEFTMDGVCYKLPKNDGENCLHGGIGFDLRMWSVISHEENKISLEYISEDGEEGFPARLTVRVSYTVEENNLIIDYVAIPDGKTPISLTNHTYFNLNGLGGDVKSHRLIFYANTYTEVGENLIPTGRHPSVIGTPFDFRAPHTIGERIGGDFIGYDHNFVLSPSTYSYFGDKKLALGAIVETDELRLSVYTDQPGIQLYIGNFLGNGPAFKGGVKQIRHGAFCLEAQTEPNSVNHGAGFYDKGEIYTQKTVYRIEEI